MVMTAVINIQRCWRGYQGRKRVKNLKEKS